MSTNKKACSILKLVLVFTHCHDKQKKYALFLTKYQHKVRIDTTSVYRELYVLGLCTAIGVSPDASDWRPPRRGLTAHL